MTDTIEVKDEECTCHGRGFPDTGKRDCPRHGIPPERCPVCGELVEDCDIDACRRAVRRRCER